MGPLVLIDWLEALYDKTGLAGLSWWLSQCWTGNDVELVGAETSYQKKNQFNGTDFQFVELPQH